MQTKAVESSAQKTDGSAGASVYVQIKRDLMANIYSAGVHVHESDLAEKYGTSRTPVREAMIRLEAEGLVEVLPRRGVRILPVSAPDMRDIYDILISLESLAAQQLAARSPDEDELENLKRSVEQMEAAYAEKDLVTWAEGDDAFHRELLRLHGNKRLISITDTMYSQAHRTQMVALRMRSTIDVSNEEHREIYQSLISGDAEGARKAMSNHRQRGGGEMLNILEEYRLPPL